MADQLAKGLRVEIATVWISLPEPISQLASCCLMVGVERTSISVLSQGPAAAPISDVAFATDKWCEHKNVFCAPDCNWRRLISTVVH